MRRPGGWHNRLLVSLSRVPWRMRTARPPGGQVQRLLLVRVDERLGNLLGLQPLLDAIRGHWPGCQLGLLASERMRPVVESLQGIDQLHLLNKRWAFRKPARWLRVLREVRCRGYQVAIDASAWHEFSYTHAVLTYYSGAPVRIGYWREGAPGKRLHNRLVKPGPEDEYEVRQRMRLLEPLGIEANPSPLRTRLGEAEAGGFRDWLADQQASRPLLGLWPGARKQLRRWPLDCWVQLAGHLRKQLDAGLVVMWGPGERGLAERLQNLAGEPCLLAPATTIPQLAGLLRSCDLVISNDTGPMHLSVAVGTPTVALFASGQPSRWGHPGPGVQNLACPGLDKAGEVELIVRACRELLAGD